MGCRRASGARRQEKGIQLGVASAFPLPTPMDLRQQLGAVAAHLFRRPLRVQKFFEQLADARITVHRVPPADDLWNDCGSRTDFAPGRLGMSRCPRRLAWRVLILPWENWSLVVTSSPAPACRCPSWLWVRSSCRVALRFGRGGPGIPPHATRTEAARTVAGSKEHIDCLLEKILSNREYGTSATA